MDEQHLVNSHQQYYGNSSGGSGEATQSGMGGAAAMQALKMFGGGSSGSSSGSSQNDFMGMAMGQASKLFGS